MRLAAVEYLNTLPFLHGLREHAPTAKYELVLGHPARCAELLLAGDVDIALCPIGALIGNENFRIIGDYGIGCDGAVRTVCVYSDAPLESLRHIRLSPASRTSNILVQVLNAYFWKHDINFSSSAGDTATTGQLCIGDRCFEMEQRYKYRVDLGQAWKDCTGMPFLFAAWVAVNPVPAEIVLELNSAFALGTGAIAQMPVAHSYPGVDPRAYLSENISYAIDQPKRASLAHFLEMAQQLQTIPAYAAQGTS